MSDFDDYKSRHHLEDLLGFMKAHGPLEADDVTARLRRALSKVHLAFQVELNDPKLLAPDLEGTVSWEVAHTQIGMPQAKIDRRAQSLLNRALHEELPAALIAGEEASPQSLSLEIGGILLATDPIDGTSQCINLGSGWALS